MPDDIRPFNPDEYVPGARITSNKSPGGRAPLIAELKQHVLGQRVTNIEVSEQPDAEASERFGLPVTQVEMTVSLENNIYYICRVYVPAGMVVQLGEGLAEIERKDPNHTKAPRK